MLAKVVDGSAEVKVYCSQENGALLRTDGETPPFDYNIDPENSLIDFNQAKTIAEAQVAEDLEYWSLRVENKYDNI